MQSNRIAYPFIWKSHAIHTYCWKCWTSGDVQWRAPMLCCRWFILVSFQLPTIQLQTANLATMNTDAVFSVPFGWLFRTTWFTRRCFDH
jgi:hypothetical protein